MKIHLCFCGFFAISVALWATASLRPAVAQRPKSTVPEVGIRDRTPQLHALTGARIVTEPGTVIEDGTLLINAGIISAIGKNVAVPLHARVADMTGKTIYPALIDAYSEIEVSLSKSDAAHWNKQVRPERDAASDWKRSGATDEKLRESGFALRLIAPSDGIFKGKCAVVTTSDAPPADSIVASAVANHLRLTAPRNAGRSEYPRSPMGAVAIARQTCYDADWYQAAWRAFRKDSRAPRPETNVALEVLSQAIQDDELFILDAADEQYALRADRFAVEFGLNVALRGSGREYQRLDAIAETNRAIIVPVNFPKPPNVATAEAARDATLSELMHWYLAPENPQRLLDAGVTIALTTHGLDEPKQFREMLRKAVERGLHPDDALRACTITPAELLGIRDQAGTLEVGKGAHLMVTDGEWLDKNTKVVETWVDGQRFEAEPHDEDHLEGVWKLQIDASEQLRRTLYLSLERTGKTVSGKVSTMEPSKEKPAEKEADAEQKSAKEASDEEAEKDDQKGEDDDSDTVSLKNVATTYGRLTASFSSKIWNSKGTVRLTATAVVADPPKLIGRLIDEVGTEISLTGTRLANDKDSPPKDDDKKQEDEQASSDKTNSNKAEESEHKDLSIAVNYPLGAFGVDSPQTNGVVIIENAIIWSCDEMGQVIEGGSVLIQDGKIAAVGKDLEAPDGAQRIDAKGKHVTPGIIDCHSHMATDGGVNEGTQAITAEVRIGDFIDATDINIYRQLAGGVTCANVLHGSANPIGGQNQVIKLRWGSLPEAMKFAEAPAGIKFALGENVKQSNWGDEFTTRYPQTRMGVEQIIRDAFIAAKQYEKEWQIWKNSGRGIPPRKDLELDALLEIVNGQRWIHCHSYRQDEILALMRTLESFGIRIGTFQHILEGYKVAKEMAEHGAMGSSFSDWWAYKFEVYDAIPYNGALMHQAGVVVSFNSDDRELARHLNHEAAKAMKYGGVSPQDALKFVTLNPAKQLRIDQYVGSLEAGKQADLVVWSGPPLSILSVCEQTWIDGVRYFDRKQDLEQREKQAELHAQLVRKILDSGETMRKRGEQEDMLRDFWPRYDEYCGHGHGHSDR